MRLVNPFTGMVLNTEVPNPKGCNQHTGPNCGGSLRKLKSFDEVPFDEDSDFQGAWITPKGDLVSSESGDHAETVADHLEEFGLSELSATKGSKSYLEHLTTARRKALESKAIRIARGEGDTSIQISSRVSPQDLADKIYEGKIPKEEKYYLEVDGYYGPVPYRDLVESSNWSSLRGLLKKRES